ncbi:hypothetical protein TrLO_g7981 [Triparma laevis f. longispina]|uniref:phosphoglycerate mutase (2,3-diphosphoglycerate-dependent) n=2 Tax=Triparma laevis TaxID=1534972 RepID=A0A9W7AT46_9STRA|nr:hypothetical protein TrLO_g7981 [Triparma laevis f. longispina]
MFRTPASRLLSSFSRPLLPTSLLRPQLSRNHLPNLGRNHRSYSRCSPLLNDEKDEFVSLNQNTPFTLCFLRHGQSTWNRDNRFIGWTDTPLTADGVLEARVAGQILYKSGLMFDEVHTSLLRRSIRTTNLVLMETRQEYIQVYKSWRLNERHYGQLVGQNKKEVVEEWGPEKVKSWRRSWDDPPPPMENDHPYYPGKDMRYRNMLEKIPEAESLKDTRARTTKFWDETVVPSLKEGKTILIVGHENNLRSMIMRLENIDPKDVINLSLPRAVPLAYKLDANLKPIPRPDGKLDEATGFLNGVWLGGDGAVKKVLERDHKQVYDTSIKENLEMGGKWNTWRNWMEFAIGETDPNQSANSAHSEEDDQINDETRGRGKEY